MWLSKLRLKNIRSFTDAPLTLSKGINVFVGANNAGKSTVLHSVLALQDTNAIKPTDLRLNTASGLVAIDLEGNVVPYVKEGPKTFQLRLPENKRIGIVDSKTERNFGQIQATEPDNFIYPYLSNRKVVKYQEQINSQHASTITGNFQHLYSKVDRVSNPGFVPAYDTYTKACSDILGFTVTTAQSQGGKKAAYIVRNLDHIPLDAMGEGVANVLGLLVDLCVAEEKLFLIEEPENDIHPESLKALLKFICAHAERNQFLITTHSNIVVKYLASHDDAKLFNVTMEFENRLPTSNVEEVKATPEDRRSVLEALGYGMVDVDLWDAWLFLEESSAEKVIREYLIPWFVPDLGNRLRTFSARTLSELPAKFSDFNRLFVYLHLQPAYKNHVWVIVDGGENEAAVLAELRDLYTASGWEAEQFRQFNQHDFESYYPASFSEDVAQVLGMTGKRERRAAKKALLDRVEEWIAENPEDARKEFEGSARDVVTLLQEIDAALKDGRAG